MSPVPAIATAKAITVITYYYNPEATAGLSSTEHLLNTRLISSVGRIAYLADFMEPASGIEPPTCGLRNKPGHFLKRSVCQMVSPF